MHRTKKRKNVGLKPEIKLNLPTAIVDLHCHGRGWQHRHKTTVLQVMKEAASSGIAITAFMPNTLPAITDWSRTTTYLDVINNAQKDLQVRQKQYLYFGALDSNHAYCDRVLALEQVIGVKVYPAKNGQPVTTGSDIGVAELSSILEHMKLAAKHGKVAAIHCDDPLVIAAEGNTKKAEVEYVIKMLGLACLIKGLRLVFCHVSCRESAELILAAQAQGIEAGIELAPHYLWFDGDGTNWNKDLSPNHYKCLNSLRSAADREYLIELAKSDNRYIFLHSDSACHTIKEKEEEGLGGLPTNQQLIPVAVTLATQHGISEDRLQQLLSFNAADFYRLTVPRTVTERTFRLRPDRKVYNHGNVKNPWKGSMLYSLHEEES
jgi:dihydroorotase